MKLNKKKKGFTLIELMAVIAIVAILAAVLVPTVNGYITRAKKTAVVTQARTIVNAVESYNITATVKITDNSTLGPVTTDATVLNLLKAAELFDETKTKVGALPDRVKYATLYEINNDPDAVSKITIVDGVLSAWGGTTQVPAK